jgi:nitrite reductase/ring-hydroxylating ferredoxin subunit
MTAPVDNPADGFVAVAGIADIPPGAMKCVAVDRARVLVANVGGAFHAISDICGHRNAPLSRGKLDGHRVECPLHFAIFDVRTGKLIDGPVSADVPSYETRVDGDTILVSLEPRPTA